MHSALKNALQWLTLGISGIAVVAIASAQSARPATPAHGPLRVSETNPLYFADPAGEIVYLTGSHTWPSLIDRGPTDPPPVFDFERYLDFLEQHDQSFIRLWARHVSWYQKYGDVELYAAPLPWQRTGPGEALDGKPKFDLGQFDPVYFDRLRSRVQAAGERGIYVSIMLFGGYQEAGPDWAGNPFHRENNVNGIDGDPNRDEHGWETQTLAEIPARVAEIQKAYVRTVIDTVNDLDNVLFEISNEGGVTSAEWQYGLIRFIRECERAKPKQHPIGMTAGWWSVDENRAILDASPADWVSYQFDTKPDATEGFHVRDPFVADGRKVSIQDSDHWWVVPLYGDAEFGRDWVWKSFCRGHNPILMEHLPPLSFVKVDHPLTVDDPGYAASRAAMAQTRRFAERMNLAEMSPSREIASSGYCLADPGSEYLVYLPMGGSVSVDLAAADRQMNVEWLNATTNETSCVEPIIGGQRREFKTPFTGAAVLYLHVDR